LHTPPESKAWLLLAMLFVPTIGVAFSDVVIDALMIVQLDLAARVCEIETAGTTFAVLMSLSNFAVGLSTGMGGRIYEWAAAGKDYRFAFNVVVGIGALCTCGCFLLLPMIRRYCEPDRGAALRLRFSLRTLLIAAGMIAVGLGLAIVVLRWS
jgi:hypothetical protein